MEIKINREIREYTEAMYFGLSLRQFICAVLACGVAVGLYFLLRPHMGMETVSWVCMLGSGSLCGHWLYQISRNDRREISVGMDQE